MARLKVEPDALMAPTLRLVAAEHRYLAKVLRLGVGDRVDLFDGAGHTAEAVVSEVSATEMTLSLGPVRVVAPSSSEIVLLVAVPKGERMDWLVEKTTELGVSRIVPVLFVRSVVKPAEGATKVRRWRSLAEQAARQSGRVEVPEVSAPSSLTDALARLPARPAQQRLALWEKESCAHLAAVWSPADSFVFLVGPEGGFVDAEIDAARTAGFVTVSLGPNILRVETAAVAALAMVQALLPRATA